MDTKNFKWMNESTIEKDENKIVIMAPPKTDFFKGNISECEDGFLPDVLCNAPFYYTEIDGDFVMKVKVTHDFEEIYDSSSIMVMKDMDCWQRHVLNIRISARTLQSALLQTEFRMMQTDVIWTAIPLGSRCAEWEMILHFIIQQTVKIFI